ncbi:hypothetical protein LEP1GSC047_2310 [Leptospira inadai serovar Lyme str. 10]|uniref:Uncharacterized protein n=2 Tax=Leptospira inadai serovar Lyme TaxID=293084 RepID=V6HZS3_9LEPT|nr:exonuclease [Leptospira inadai]EQA38514.1 hypothetical protein LEP1GSC047_2310 [Leptospira inadai serovar Lyme str. 10]PNV72834.1 exonuclease [Leptospira inadai serovar Lyme]
MSSTAELLKIVTVGLDLPYLNLFSKDSFKKGDRPYYDPEAEHLLIVASDFSNLEGLKAGKIPYIANTEGLDRKVKENILNLVKDRLIAVVPRISFNTDSRELGQTVHIIALDRASRFDPLSIKTLFIEIMRRSAWAIRNYEILRQTEREVKLPILFQSFAENKPPTEGGKVEDALDSCLRKVHEMGLCSPLMLRDSKIIIRNLIYEDGFLALTKNAGYVYIPEQNVDEAYQIIAELYSSKAIRTIVDLNPQVALELVSFREEVLQEETRLSSGNLSSIYKKIYAAEFPKLEGMLPKDTPINDFFRVGAFVTKKSLAYEEYESDANEKANITKIKSLIKSGKKPLDKFLTFSLGADIPYDSPLIENAEEDDSILSYVYYGDEFPELCICRSDDATIREVIIALSERYSFENPTSYRFILLLNKYKKKLLSVLSDSDAQSSFCSIAFSCLAKNFPWYVRFAYFIGFRGAMLSSILRELGNIQHKQLNERLRFTERLSAIKTDLRRELVEEVRNMIYNNEQYPEGI